MGLYADVLLPHCIDFACGAKGLLPERQKVAEGLHGVVLEIGFGSGLNVPCYPRAVTRVLGVDPSGRALRIAAKRIASAPCPIDFVGLEAEAIAVEDASVDTALCTFTLCTIAGAESALREVRRALVPGGTFHFLEHGRAPDPSVARWQDRLNGVQRALFGGCNLNRDIAALVRSAGLSIRSLAAGYHPAFPGPRTHSYLCSGVAVAPAPRA